MTTQGFEPYPQDFGACALHVGTDTPLPLDYEKKARDAGGEAGTPKARGAQVSAQTHWKGFPGGPGPAPKLENFLEAAA